MATEDPYLYPGTQTLRNLREICDPGELAVYETRVAAGRLVELDIRPIVGDFDRAHLQAIHKHIFQDVYKWAGQLRTVEIAKPGSPFFAFERYLVSSLDNLTDQLKAQGQLLGLATDDFAIRAGHYLGEINAIHPFREGNGRTQQEFIRELALKAGHRIEWTTIAREQMCAASKVSFEQANSSGLAAVIAIAIISRDSERAILDAPLAVARDCSGVAEDATAILSARAPTARIVEVDRGNREIKGEVIATSAMHAAIATSPASFVIVDREALDVARTKAQEVTQLRADVGDVLQPQPRRRRR
jgi:cell filamentation protein